MADKLFSIPADGIPHFDELYVVSDLHMGGPSDFQIFNSADELVRLIDYLCTRLPDKKIAFLINGDFVDFLAEAPAKYFDPEGAVDKLDRIAGEKGNSYFKPVFEVLKKFAKKKNRRLIISLGNHDLELALPWVRARLLEILSGGDEAAAGRITFAFDGAGFRCGVGSAAVLCVHGNEVDIWNVTDYETIRRFGREVTQGRPINNWIPNAGSQLVIDVMNDLKRKYPFVDLLKPEWEAVVPTLLALAPDQHDKLRAIAATARRLWRDKIRRMTGFLGREAENLKGGTAAAEILPSRQAYFPAFGSSGTEGKQYAEMLLDDAEDRFLRGVSPMSLAGDDELERYLGLTSAVVKLFRGEDTAEVLREALSELDKDRSFDPTTEDETFTLLDEQIGADVDFLITGHTHLARALARKKKKGWYFNSGTWVRLIKLEDRVLGDAQEFKKLFDTFKQGSMEALDAAPNLVMHKLSVVVIRTDGGQTHGELRQVNLPMTDDILPEHTNYRFTTS